MKVELLHNTPLWVCSKAIRKCWASEDKSDSKEVTELCEDPTDRSYITYFKMGEKDKALIYRVGNKNKHSSTLEHLVYTFDIDGISRACLQEVARHRIASYSVKSTRYTLKELAKHKYFSRQRREDFANIEDASKFVVFTGNAYVDDNIFEVLINLQHSVSSDNIDVAKYCLPEAYKTSLVMTINARSLQNFLSLRTSKSALWEIRDLAYAMFEELPSDHKYLFEDFLYKEPSDTTEETKRTVEHIINKRRENDEL